MPRVSPNQRRSTRHTSGSILVPSDATSRRVQVALAVQAADRSNAGLTLTLTVERSPDGSTWIPAARAVWVGNSKPTRPGWPSNGPAVRLNTVPLRGYRVRATIEGSTVTYAVDIDEVN